MDANKSSMLAQFEKKVRLEVPLFQRQYVWNEEHQWQPLWEDIERKFSESMMGRKDGPVHFLGAMVLDQKKTPSTHVERRQVIDGQQRLTTLQIFLAVFRDFCAEQDHKALADECGKFTLNSGMMADPDVDRFKVWPTQLDRVQFKDVMTAGSREELLRRYPLVKKKYARNPEPRPRMVEAYLFFYGRVKVFFLGENGEQPLAFEVPMADRLEECFQTLRNSLMVVVIDLEEGDDPQVIFETLNARGEPLLPADLLRNYIFLRASWSEGTTTELLYKKYWARFDDDFWRVEVKQGRLTRPRSDLYLQHFLSSRQGRDIPVKHLYVEYRHWVEREKPFANVEEELATLARQGDDFRRMLEPSSHDPLKHLMTFLEIFDIRTAYPLLLAMLDAKIDDDTLASTASVLESYLLRRAVSGLPTKNYNKIFLSLTRSLRREGFTVEALSSQLIALSGMSSEWPSDASFKESWLTKPFYEALNSPKLVYILSRLNETYRTAKSEALEFKEKPTIEHIMPAKWVEHWPLTDGTKGLTRTEWLFAAEGDLAAKASQERDRAIQTIGNLTILSSALNASQSNSAWKDKRPALLAHSLLPINLMLADVLVWDEAAIRKRGEELLLRALKIWRRPL
jgi:hypothetical protein